MDKRSIIIIGAVVVLLVVAGCNKSTTDKVSFINYKSAEGWSIDYPGNWTTREAGGLWKSTIFTAPGKIDGLETTIEVGYFPNTLGASEPVEKLIRVEKNSVETSYNYIPSTLSINIIDLTVGKAIRTDYSFKIGDEIYLSSGVNLYKGGFEQKDTLNATAYRIDFINPEKAERMYADVFEEMLKSFTISD